MAPERVTICVTPGFSQWSVRERGYEKPIAYFMAKEDAVKYATALARTKETALLQVLDERSRVISEQRFELELEPETPPAPAETKPGMPGRGR